MSRENPQREVSDDPIAAQADPPSPAPSDAAAVYGSVFWLCYLANMLLIVAVAILFRYGNFIEHINGTGFRTEFHLGLVVGVGMIGALLARGFQGIAIDRYGPRCVWLVSLSLLIVSLLAHVGIERVDRPTVYLVRILYMTSLAGTFGASITYVSLRTPARRVPEVIGTLGSSGFFGIALGPVLADWIFAKPVLTDWIFAGSALGHRPVHAMFILAAAITMASLLCAAVATRQPVRRPLTRRPPMMEVVRRYHPGPLLLIGIAMGVGVGLPSTFLQTYTEELGISRIGTFFVVYAATAFAVRIATRRFPERFGNRPLILIAMGSLSASMMLYLIVHSEWLLALPAVAGGVAHALLFPSVVGSGSVSFPARYRGLGTTLMLAMFDIGNLVGQPLVGGLVEGSRWCGLPPYPTMFVTVAVAMAGMALVYAAMTRNDPAPNAAVATL